MKFRLAVAAAGALALGCSSRPTTLRLDIAAAPGVSVQSLTLTIDLDGADGGVSEPLSGGAAPALPGRAVVRFADVARDVAVALDGSDDAGNPLHAATTVRLVPHAEVTAALTVGAAIVADDLGGAPDDLGAGDLGTPPPADLAGCTLGARCGYALERRLTITNGASAALPAGYTVRVPLDAANFPAGQVRADLDDVRLFGDAPDGEHARVVDLAPPGQTRALWFALAHSIAAGASDTSYAVLYDDPAAGAPPADGTKVFALYDDFTTATASAIWKVNGAPVFAGGVATLRKNQQDALTTTAASDGVPTSSVVEWRSLMTDPASAGQVTANGTFWWWVGYQHTGDFDPSEPWLVWIQRSATDLHGEVKDSSSANCASAAGCLTNSVPALDTSFHWYRIERDAAQTRFYVDGTAMTPVNDANSVDYSVMLRNWAVTSDLQVDWIRARALVSPEPTVTVGPAQPVQ